MTDVVVWKKLLLVAINVVHAIVNKMSFTVQMAPIANDSPLTFHQYRTLLSSIWSILLTPLSILIYVL